MFLGATVAASASGPVPVAAGIIVTSLAFAAGGSGVEQRKQRSRGAGVSVPQEGQIIDSCDANLNLTNAGRVKAAEASKLKKTSYLESLNLDANYSSSDTSDGGWPPDDS